MLFSFCRYCLTERRGLRHRVAQLEAKLEAETERNRQREDELVSRLLTSSGTYGIPARRPAKEEAKRVAAETAPKPLTGTEEARLAAYIQAALDAGKTVADAEQLFYEQRKAGYVEVFSPPTGVF